MVSEKEELKSEACTKTKRGFMPLFVLVCVISLG